MVENIKIFGFYNAGQDCTAACRMYVGSKIYDRVVADMASAASSITFNAAADDANEMGPLISARQRSRVASFVERAAELKHVAIPAGGKVASGKGFFYEPTIVAGARQEDEIVRREVFGPVVSITPFKMSRMPSPGPMTAIMASPHRSGRAMSARAWPRRRSFAMAAPG